jgi:methionine biosynthesis protein MetW
METEARRHRMTRESTKLEHEIVLKWVTSDASVLDLGCGDGALLTTLIAQKHVNAQGIEIDADAIHECVAKGLSVFQQDVDTGLSEYPNKSFDYVILNQSLQQVVKLEAVFQESLRVGRKVIIGIPNFAYYRARFQIFFVGRTPVTPSLPYMWYDTPNLHFLSISDFLDYSRKKRLHIEKMVFLDGETIIRIFPNLLAQIGIFLISGGQVKAEG